MRDLRSCCQPWRGREEGGPSAVSHSADRALAGTRRVHWVHVSIGVLSLEGLRCVHRIHVSRGVLCLEGVARRCWQVMTAASVTNAPQNESFSATVHRPLKPVCIGSSTRSRWPWEVQTLQRRLDTTGVRTPFRSDLRPGRDLFASPPSTFMLKIENESRGILNEDAPARDQLAQFGLDEGHQQRQIVGLGKQETTSLTRRCRRRKRKSRHWM